MGRRNEHTREQQRDMALAAAELLIVREGIAGFSMRKVAQAIGYTVGNLYLLFTNQDDLLGTINERTTDAIHAFLQDALEGETGPRDRLRALGSAYIEFAQRHPNRFRLMFEHRMPAEMLPRPTADTRLRRMFALVEENLRPVLPHAKPEALRAAATMLWSGVHGVCVLAVSGKLEWSGLEDFRELSDGVVDLGLAGLESGALTRKRRRSKR